MPSPLDPGGVEARLAEIRAGTEGWVARRFNKPISFVITRRLICTAVTPNQITAANLVLALVAASLVAWGSFPWRLVGGVLIQFHSILDGCDGEVAKLTGQSSTCGAWFDTLSDDLANNLFLAALYYGLWRETAAAWIVVTGLAVTTASLGLSLIIIHYLVTVAGTGRAQDFRLAWERGFSTAEVRPTFYRRYLKPLLKRDFFLLLMAVSIAIDLRLPFFVAAAVGVTVGFVLYAVSFGLAARLQAGRG